MNKNLLTIALLVAMPILSSHSNNTVGNNVIEKNISTVCVSYSVTGAGPNTAYFYTKACALTFQSNFPPHTTTLVTGNFCVDEGFVFICL